MQPVKHPIHRSKSLSTRSKTWTISTLALLGITIAPATRADLPVQQAPTTVGAGAGDWLNLILGYIGDAGKVLGLAIAVGGFIYVAWTGFAKFNEARQGRAEWSEVIVLAVVGAAWLLLSSFLLREASTTISGAIT